LDFSHAANFKIEGAVRRKKVKSACLCIKRLSVDLNCASRYGLVNLISERKEKKESQKPKVKEICGRNQSGKIR
jgi:hypothetical protein